MKTAKIMANVYNVEGRKEVIEHFEIKFLIDDGVDDFDINDKSDNLLPRQKLYAEMEFIEDLRKIFPKAHVINHGNEYLPRGIRQKKSYRKVIIRGLSEGDEAMITFYCMNDTFEMLLESYGLLSR